MTGKTHAILGINSLWIIVLLYGWEFSPTLFVIASFGALLPDIDASDSKVQHLRIGGKHLSVKPLQIPGMIISSIFKHRGFFHSLIAVILFGIGAVYLTLYLNESLRTLDDTYWVAFVLGYLSHIVADASTKSGVYFLWPLKKPIGLLPKNFRIKTKGYVEQIVFVIGIMGILSLAWIWTTQNALSLA